MEPLYVEPEPLWKIAAGAQMPVNDAEWAAAILGELYKQAPYLEQGYEVEIKFDEKDAQRGYAYGRVIVYNATNLGQDKALGPEGAKVGVRYVQIPFIIRDYRLAPLDLIMLPNGEFRPQNRKRLRDALFRPEIDDGASPGRWNTLLDISRYPLGVGGFGGYPLENMSAQILPYDKMGSLRPRSLLVALAPLEKKACLELARELDDPWCLGWLSGGSPYREQTRALLEKVGELASVDGAVSARAEDIPPSVMMVTRHPGPMYRVKKANTEAFEPAEDELDRGQALEALGPDTVRDVDTTGMAVMSTSPVQRSELVEEKVEPVKEFGLYRVKAVDGRSLLGWVFPKVIDLDGVTLPSMVFNNGSENAVQNMIVGVRAGSSMDLLSARIPRGPGLFYRVTGDSALALVPLVVETASEDPDGTRVYTVSKMDGRRAMLHAAPGVSGISPMDEQGEHFVIPGDMKFMPLPNEYHVTLIEDPEAFSKMAHARRDTLRIVYDGGNRYSLHGCGLDKLGANGHLRIPAEEALFLSAAVGMHPGFAVTKLARARAMGVVTVPKLRPITTLHERLVLEETKLADAGYGKWAARVPRPLWLVKEALVLDDPDSADKVLSLGFITPHNVSVFLSYVPDLDRALGQVCHVLFGARLAEADGSELEAAAERAMHGLENTLSGLELVGLELRSEQDVGD